LKLPPPSDIVKGAHNAFWGLISQLQTAYPDTKPDGARFLSVSKLPYEAKDMRRLSKSLLCWLYSLGLLGLQTAQEDGAFRFETIEAELRTGVLLCEVVGGMLSEKIIGVFEEPRTEATRKANISKAIKRLRSHSKMGLRFLTLTLTLTLILRWA